MPWQQSLIYCCYGLKVSIEPKLFSHFLQHLLHLKNYYHIEFFDFLIALFVVDFEIRVRRSSDTPHVVVNFLYRYHPDSSILICQICFHDQTFQSQMAVEYNVQMHWSINASIQAQSTTMVSSSLWLVRTSQCKARMLLVEGRTHCVDALTLIGCRRS